MNSPTPRIVAKPKKAIYVKVKYDDQVKRITGTGVREEQGPGSLVVFDGLDVVARFWGDVERWWIEDS
jgi:hypothetical protein